MSSDIYEVLHQVLDHIQKTQDQIRSLEIAVDSLKHQVKMVERARWRAEPVRAGSPVGDMGQLPEHERK